MHVLHLNLTNLLRISEHYWQGGIDNSLQPLENLSHFGSERRQAGKKLQNESSSLIGQSNTLQRIWTFWQYWSQCLWQYSGSSVLHPKYTGKSSSKVPQNLTFSKVPYWTFMKSHVKSELFMKSSVIQTWPNFSWKLTRGAQKCTNPNTYDSN